MTYLHWILYTHDPFKIRGPWKLQDSNLTANLHFIIPFACLFYIILWHLLQIPPIVMPTSPIGTEQKLYQSM